MGCISKQILNDESGLRRIKRWINHRPDWEQQIRDNYENAEDIIRILKSKGENISLADLSINNTPKQQEQVKSVNQFAVKDVSIDVNYGGDKAALDRMIRNFRNKILNSSVYNMAKGSMVNANLKLRNSEFSNVLNKNIYDYKIELVNTIWNLVQKGRKTVFESPYVFINEMNEALTAYDNYKGDINSGEYQAARDAYSILKNFDSLLEQQASFIKVNKKYTSINEAYDKYIYEGANTDMFKTWVTKEDVDIEGQLSDLISTIIEAFPKYNKLGQPMWDTGISIPEYNRTMSLFKSWITSGMLASDVGIRGGNAESTFKKFKDSIFRIDINTSERAKVADENLKKAFDAFVGKAKLGQISQVSLELIQGINAIFQSGLDQQIKNAMLNLMFKTDENRGIITSTYNNTISNKSIQENYISRAVYQVQDSINSAIDKFKWSSPQAYKNLKAKYGIRVDSNNHDKIYIDAYKLTLIYRPTGDIEVCGKVGNDIAAQMITDILNLNLPTNYNDILIQMRGSNNYAGALFNQFKNAIGMVLFASDPDAFNSSINDDKNWKNGKDDPLRSVFNVRMFSTGLQSASEMLGIGWGINIASTQRNSFGNNIAAYTLTSLINQMERNILNMDRKENSIFKDNPVYKEFFTHVGKPYTRIDVDISKNKKAARDLTLNELATTGIFYDFFKNYKKFISGASNYIYFQNSCFSDKNTHWLIPYHKDFKLDSTNTLGGTLDLIFSQNKHDDGVKIFMDSIFNTRKSEYSKIFNNIASDYIMAFDYLANINKVIPESIKSDVLNLKSSNAETKLNALRNISNYVSNNKDFTEVIKYAFAANKLDFTEELHYSKVGFNETLDHDIQMYVLDSTKSKFNNRIQQQKELFVKDLHDCDFSFNGDLDNETYNQVKSTIGDSWFDDNQEMLITKDGKLNPLLEAYYLSDILLSNGYNDLLFGKTFFHPNKYKPTKEELDIKNKTGKWPESYFIHSEASRLSASYKRTVIAGATTHTFYPDTFGISSDINFAVMEDYKADPYNMNGVTSGGIDAMDGSGWSSPIQSLLENMSLLDAKVGWDKKTIFGDIDPKTGCPTLLKWAVYALTNERRRNSECSVISANSMFKKMHNIAFNKRINIAEYYNPSKGTTTTVNGRKVSESNYIYYQDVESGSMFRIDRLEQDQNNIVHIFETKVNNFGQPIGNTFEKRRVQLNTINAIDEIFGGAYAMQKDDSGRLAWSDVNNRLCANIVCNEDLKQNMIAYAVNKSAIKVGARNVNLRSSWTDNSELLYTNMSLIFGGVQMDADHVLGDDTDVTEMSQMISSLIQSGLAKEQAIDIYKEIGEVVTESLKNKNYLVYNGDYSAVHELLGREFINSFSKGTRDTMGLAQSYLIKASQELAKDPNAKINIPFSDPTVLGIFTSNIASEINKKGIKRKYAGIASVQVPSRGMIQYFNYNGRQMLYTTLAKKIREAGYQFTAKQYITTQRYNKDTGNFEIYGLNRNSELVTEIHPFIRQVNPWELDMGDTVIVVKNGVASKPIVLDTWNNYDTIKHITDGVLYKWSIRPVDLRQSDITFEVNGKRYSIYDLDSVRATHYIKELINNKQSYFDLTPEKKLAVDNTIGDTDKNNLIKLYRAANLKVDEDLKKINNGIKIGRNSAFGDIIGRKYVNLTGAVNGIEDIIIANNNINNREQLFEDIIANSKNINVVRLLKRIVQEFNLDPQEFTAAYTQHSLDRENEHNFSNVNTRFAEIITGKINKTQLGLRDDDSIADVKDANFFINRIKENESLRDSNINTNSYDAVLKGINGENLYVRISPLHTEIDAVTGEKIPEQLPGWFVNNTTFDNVDGNIYYKDKVLCTADGKQFYTQPGVTNVNNMVVLNSIEQLQELLDSDLFNRVEYNYNSNNLNEILKYRGYINDEGLVTKEIKFHQAANRLSPVETDRFRLRYIVGKQIEVGTDITKLDIESLIEDLNQEVEYEKDRDIKQIAYNRFNAFKKQLEVIGARIPTQSMQSYMGLKIVALTNSIYNEVYIPAAMAWLEGSNKKIKAKFGSIVYFC